MRSLTDGQTVISSKRRLSEVYLFDIQLQGGGPLLHFATRNIIVGGVKYLAYVSESSGISRKVKRKVSANLNPDIRITFIQKQFMDYAHLSEIDSDYTFTFAPITISKVLMDDFGNQQAPLPVFVGRMDAIDEEDHESFTCNVSHLSSYLNRMKLQQKIELSTYPKADPKDMGKAVPKIFGTVTNIPGICINAGGLTRLIADCFSTDMKCYVALAPKDPKFPAPPFYMMLKGVELVHVSAVGTDAIGNYFTFDKRGLSYWKTGLVNGVLTSIIVNAPKVDHLAGTTVYEYPATLGSGAYVSNAAFTYLFADAPIKEIATVRVNDLQAIANFTAQASDPAFRGMATVKFSAAFIQQRAVSLAIDDPEHGHAISGLGYTYTYKLYFSIASGVTLPSSGAQLLANNVVIWQYMPPSLGVSFENVPWTGVIMGDVLTLSWNPLSGDGGKMTFNFLPGCTRGGNNGINDQAPYAPSGGYVGGVTTQLTWPASPSVVEANATGIGLGGSSAADCLIGGTVTVDAVGHIDDSAGTVTGTPNAVIENPAHNIKKWLLLAGLLPAEIGASFATAAASLAAELPDTPAGYTFDYAYMEALRTQSQPDQANKSGGRSLEELVDELAFQARCIFYWGPAGTAELAFIPSVTPGIDSIDIISEDQTVDGFHFGRTSEQDIFNDFLCYCDYIYSSNDYRSKEGSWADSCIASDAKSQAKYASQPGVPALFHKQYELWTTRNHAQMVDWLAYRKLQEKDLLLPVEFTIDWRKGITKEPGDSFSIYAELHLGIIFWIESVEEVEEGFYKVNAVSWPDELQKQSIIEHVSANGTGSAVESDSVAMHETVEAAGTGSAQENNAAQITENVEADGKGSASEEETFDGSTTINLEVDGKGSAQETDNLSYTENVEVDGHGNAQETDGQAVTETLEADGTGSATATDSKATTVIFDTFEGRWGVGLASQNLQSYVVGWGPAEIGGPWTKNGASGNFIVNKNGFLGIAAAISSNTSYKSATQAKLSDIVEFDIALNAVTTSKPQFVINFGTPGSYFTIIINHDQSVFAGNDYIKIEDWPDSASGHGGAGGATLTNYAVPEFTASYVHVKMWVSVISGVPYLNISIGGWNAVVPINTAGFTPTGLDLTALKDFYISGGYTNSSYFFVVQNLKVSRTS